MSKWVVDTCVIIDVLSGDGGLRPVDITDLRKEEDDLSNAAKQSRGMLGGCISWK